MICPHFLVVFLQRGYDAYVPGLPDACTNGFQMSGSGRVLSSGHGCGFVIGNNDGYVSVFIDAVQQSRHA